MSTVATYAIGTHSARAALSRGVSSNIVVEQLLLLFDITKDQAEHAVELAQLDLATRVVW